MDLSPVILGFASTYTVTRKGANTVDSNGYTSAGSSSTLSVMGVFQPRTGRKLQREKDGQRTTEVGDFFTPTQLRGQDAPDLISINGQSWQVEKVERWAELGGYWRAEVRKVGD